MTAAWHFVVHLLGVDQGLPYGHWNWYNFHSGAGATLELAAWGTALWWWHNNCRGRWWCPLTGRHEFTDPADGVTRRLCWVHHPDVKSKHLTRRRVEEIQERRMAIAPGNQSEGQ